MIDDRDRSLTYSFFFDAAAASTVCNFGSLHAGGEIFAGTAEQEGRKSLTSVVMSLALNISASEG